MNDKIVLLFSVLLILTSCSSSSKKYTLNLSSKRPKWVDYIPQNPNYKYYVGRASNVRTEKLGIEHASRNAWEQAIRENFGFITRISKETTETLKDINYKKSLQELSKKVQIIGFEQNKIHLEKSIN